MKTIGRCSIKNIILCFYFCNKKIENAEEMEAENVAILFLCSLLFIACVEQQKSFLK
jgi:hypothetical protein